MGGLVSGHHVVPHNITSIQVPVSGRLWLSLPRYRSGIDTASRCDINCIEASLGLKATCRQVESSRVESSPLVSFHTPTPPSSPDILLDDWKGIMSKNRVTLYKRCGCLKKQKRLLSPIVGVDLGERESDERVLMHLGVVC